MKEKLIPLVLTGVLTVNPLSAVAIAEEDSVDQYDSLVSELMARGESLDDIEAIGEGLSEEEYLDALIDYLTDLNDSTGSMEQTVEAAPEVSIEPSTSTDSSVGVDIPVVDVPAVDAPTTDMPQAPEPSVDSVPEAPDPSLGSMPEAPEPSIDVSLPEAPEPSIDVSMPEAPEPSVDPVPEAPEPSIDVALPEPEVSAQPVEPIEPIEPVEPVQPIEPVDPQLPEGPDDSSQGGDTSSPSDNDSEQGDNNGSHDGENNGDDPNAGDNSGDNPGENNDPSGDGNNAGDGENPGEGTDKPLKPFDPDASAPLYPIPEFPVPENPIIPDVPDVTVRPMPGLPTTPSVPQIPQLTPSTPTHNNGGNFTVHHYTQNFTTEKFIAVIGEQARAIGQEKGLYASVMIAQAILESGSGSSMLSQAPYNNLFGIKGAYQGKSAGFSTLEDNGSGQLFSTGAQFRAYPTIRESLADYGDLLKEGLGGYYKGAWKSYAATPAEAAQYLQGRYATDTSYASKLVGLINTYDLTRFDNPLPYAPVDPTIDLVDLIAETTSHLGEPYVWGGELPGGFDCSGLVRYCYREALGIDLPRTTQVQCLMGEDVMFSDLHMGDLLFFEDGGDVHHVAMYLGDGYYIHAPQPGEVVKVSSLDEYTPDFAKRIVPTTGSAMSLPKTAQGMSVENLKQKSKGSLLLKSAEKATRGKNTSENRAYAAFDVSAMIKDADRVVRPERIEQQEQETIEYVEAADAPVVSLEDIKGEDATA